MFMSLTTLASLVHNERICFAIVGIMVLGWEELLSEDCDQSF